MVLAVPHSAATFLPLGTQPCGNKNHYIHTATNNDPLENVPIDDPKVQRLACNGLEAVNTVRQAPANFDFVLMDLRMQVIDGIEATTCIRMESQTQSLALQPCPLSPSLQRFSHHCLISRGARSQLSISLRILFRNFNAAGCFTTPVVSPTPSRTGPFLTRADCQ